VSAELEPEICKPSAAVPHVVEFKGVTKTFDPGTPRAFTALKDVSFFVEDKPNYGEFVAIVGPSGCGKSTVLNLIHGFPEVYPPTAGEVFVRGEPVKGPGKDRGMIFQKYSSFPNRTVLRNVTFGLELNQRELALSRSEMDDLAMAWIRKVGLQGHEKKYPYQLSGGQQQRVAIARAIAKNPAVLLCDEPTGALDSATGIVVLEALERVNKALHTTTAVITHNADIAGMADRVIHLSDGNVAKVEHNASKKKPRELHW
jgi:ABC-type nitrate/sulfonate/bicarbonate transport system ATPase subunit